MPHIIKTVAPLPNYELQVHFRNGSTKRYDMKPMIEQIDIYRHYLVDQKLFQKVQVSEDGEAVVWSDYLDIGCEELWTGGKDAKSPFDSLLSGADAAAIWHLDESTLRKAIADGRFRIGIDTMKFGKQWVVTYKAMTREYGDLEKQMANFYTDMELFG